MQQVFGCALKIQVRRWFLVLALVAWTGGCATRNISEANRRPFVFGQDTFFYRNDLVWEYVFDDASGRTSHRPREPKSDYTHHCFVVARSARQFFQFARFDPAQPVADEKTYRRLIERIVARDPMRSISDEERIVIREPDRDGADWVVCSLRLFLVWRAGETGLDRRGECGLSVRTISPRGGTGRKSRGS